MDPCSRCALVAGNGQFFTGTLITVSSLGPRASRPQTWRELNYGPLLALRARGGQRPVLYWDPDYSLFTGTAGVPPADLARAELWTPARAARSWRAGRPRSQQGIVAIPSTS